MSEKVLIHHCAPTLAGLKTGSLFTAAFESREEMCASVRDLNRRLGKKGLRILPMRYRNGRGLIYIYRPSHLSRDLDDELARTLLRERGYACEDHARCVAQLVKKLNTSDEFPHEIGCFLGYPPEDVAGFIEQGAHGSKFVGAWRVYGDEERARALFAKYRKCTGVYEQKHSNGRTVEQLTVAR